MDFSQYANQLHAGLHSHEHHDLDDTDPYSRQLALPTLGDGNANDSFNPLHDADMFDMHPNPYALYHSPSINPLLFQDPMQSLSGPTSQAGDGISSYTTISPATMWLGHGSTVSSRSQGSAKPTSPRAGVTDHTERSLSSENSLDRRDSAVKRKDSQFDGSDSSKKSRKESSTSNEEEVTSNPSGAGSKREKYREKNRVAAVKCRAKKKDHVDTLEESHRTQSVLNVALKQTEQSLRDELSFWRTQALQHSFCSCKAIQDYNMRQAHQLAGGSLSINGNKTPEKPTQAKSDNNAKSVSPE